MTYDPKFKENNYFVAASGAWSYVGNTNFYFFRGSDKNIDNGGYFDAYDWNLYIFTDEEFPNDIFAYYFNAEKTTVTIGTYDYTDGRENYDAVTLQNLTDMLGLVSNGGNFTHKTTGFYFTKDGVVDFANATGHVVMGEDIDLDKPVITVENLGSLYGVGALTDIGKVEPLSTSIVDVTALFAGDNLTIEGSLNSVITVVVKNTAIVYDDLLFELDSLECEHWWDVDYKNQFTGIDESRFTHISNRRLVTSALRGETISLELNMLAEINVDVKNQYYLDFVKTTFENVTIQTAGFLADGSSVAGETGMSISNGTLALGNTVGGHNSIWSGDVNVIVNNIEIGSRMYEKYDPNPAINKGGVGDYTTFGNTDSGETHPVTGGKYRAWEWGMEHDVDDFSDPDFVDDSSKTKSNNNTVVTHGLYGKNVELGNMTKEGEINVSVENVTLYSEFAYGTGLDPKESGYSSTPGNSGNNYEHMLYYKEGDSLKAITPSWYYNFNKEEKDYYVFTNNKAEVSGIEADNLKIAGNFEGTITADLHGIKSVVTETEFRYEEMEWLFEPYALTTEPQGVDENGDPVEPEEYSVTPITRWVFNENDFEYCGYHFDEATGYVYIIEEDGTEIYEDPYTGYYFDPAEPGKLYANYGFDPATGEVILLDETTFYKNGKLQDIEYEEDAVKGETLFAGTYGAYQRFVRAGQGYYNRKYASEIAKYKTFRFEQHYEDDFVMYERKIIRNSTALNLQEQESDRGYSYAFLGSLHGIHAKDSITIDGPFTSQINVTAGDSFFKTFTVRGIETATLKATNGLFAPEVNIEIDETIKAVINKEDPDKSNGTATSITCLVIGTLTTEALGGSYTVLSEKMGKSFVWQINNFDSAFDNDANPSTFNIIADVDADFNVFANCGSWDLRFSGDIRSGKQSMYSFIYGTKDEEESTGVTAYNEVFDIAAGAYMEGNWNFGVGDDTLTIDSNARMRGEIVIGDAGMTGTFNMIFNLNDSVLKASDAKTTVEHGAILEGLINCGSSGQIASTLLVTVCLNDVVLKKNDAGEIQSNTYTILAGQPADFENRFDTVQLKYDGLNQRTQGNLEVQIGYYDENGEFKSNEYPKTGYEIRANNFIANIGTTAARDNVVRVVDRDNKNTVIFEAHSELKTATDGTKYVDIIVDCLPDMVELPDGSGDTYYVATIDSGIENLHDWYNVTEKTYTVVFDDHSVDLSKISYAFEYYIQDVDAQGNVIENTDTNTILREIKKTGDLNPRTEITLNGIGENQKVFWRVRQIYGSGGDCSGKWYSIDDYQFVRPQDLCQIENSDGSYTLEWKHQAGATYLVKYTFANGEEETVKVTDFANSTDRKAFCTITPATPADRLLSWNVTAVEGDNDTAVSETATYQDLQIEKTVLATPTGFKVHQDEKGDVVFTWSNSCKSTQVTYKLEYRVVGSNGDVAWSAPIDVKADSDIAKNVTQTVTLDKLPTSDEKLEWRVTAYQDNGEEMLYSKIGNAISSIKTASGGSITFKTSAGTTIGTDNDVMFTWDYDNDIERGFLFEYIAGGNRKTVEISRANAISSNIALSYYNEQGAVEYIYTEGEWIFQQQGEDGTLKVLNDADLRNLSFSCNYEGGKLIYDAVTGKVNYILPLGSNAAGNIEWRVRELNNAGEVDPNNKWYIYETEHLSHFDTVTDGDTATLKFESNVIGSSYCLEYIIVNTKDNGYVPLGVSEVIQYDNVKTKYFEHKVTGLGADQTVAWRVSVKSAGDSAFGEWQYAATNMDAAFNETYLLDAPTSALNRVESNSGTMDINGKTAVASLYWEPGANVSRGLSHYIVEFFQSQKALDATAITERFENNEVESAKYARVEVTNNELTLSGLNENEYIYWRVQAMDKADHKSDWTIGDPLHIALDDKDAPVFNYAPEATQEWVVYSETPERQRYLRDIYLTWQPAADDNSGVKEYQFSLLGGLAEHLQDAVYEYSLDGGETWLTMEYKDGFGLIEHLDSVTSYVVRVSNVGNSDFEWSLTAVDFQNKITTIKSTTSASDAYTGWKKDETKPQFVQQNEEYMDAHLNYTDIKFTMGSELVDGKFFCMTPTITWTSAGDDLLFNEDFSEFNYSENGSGVDYYILEWNMFNNTFRITIDVDVLENVVEVDDGKCKYYTWTLDPNELLAQNAELVNENTGYPLVIPNADYSWKFYAVDHVGNISAPLSPVDRDTYWKADLQAPVFNVVDELTEDNGAVKTNTVGTELLSITVTWKAADDYWFDPAEDVNTPGSGVKFYTLTYSCADGSIGKIENIAAVDGQNTVQFFAPNKESSFTIFATDYCGNVTDQLDAITGSWQQIENPAQLNNIKSEVTYKPEDGGMIGQVSWEAESTEAAYYALSYGKTLDAAAEYRILKGFTGDNIDAFKDIITYKGTGTENEWTVSFKDADTTSYTLKYDSATGGYTMSLSGISLAFDGKNGFHAKYEIPTHGDYAWFLKAGSGDEYISSDMWEGDSQAPVFDSEAITGVLEEVLNEATGKLDSTITITIDKDKVSDNFGSGVKCYSVVWGTVDSGLYDNLVETYVDNTDNKTAVFSFNVATTNEKYYHYRVIAVDYAGNSVSVDGPTLLSGDSKAPYISDIFDPITEISRGDNKMSGELSWKQGNDDKHIFEDGQGTGIANYTLTLVSPEGVSLTPAMSILGDKLTAAYGNNEDVIGYSRVTDEETGQVSYIRSFKFEGTNIKGRLIFTLDETGRGQYKVEFTGLEAKDYKWNLTATDYKGNTSVKYPGSDKNILEGDNELPRLSVVQNSTDYIGDRMIVELEITSSSDEGTGIKDYTFAVTKTELVDDESEGSSGEPIEIVTIVKEVTFSTSLADYTKVDDGSNNYRFQENGVTVLYNLTTGKYNLTVELDNYDYSWNVTARDFAGNVSTPVIGNWHEDVEAPVFIADVKDSLDISKYHNGKMAVTASWIYNQGEDGNTVVDPAAKGAKDDSGSGIDSFTFYWRVAESSTWNSLEISTSASSVEKGDILIQNKNGVYTVSSVSLNPGKYEWYVTATDRTGHVSAGPFVKDEKPATGDNTSDKEETPVVEKFQDVECSGYWNGIVQPTFNASKYTDVEYVYRPGYDNDVIFTWSAAEDGFKNSDFGITYTISWGTVSKGTEEDSNSVFTPAGSINVISTALIENNDGTFSYFVKDNAFADGEYSWVITAKDQLGNTATLNASEKFLIDHTAPQGKFSTLGSVVNVIEWNPIEDEWLGPDDEKEVKYYLAKDAAVTFTFENTFTDANGVTYEVRTYGKGTNSQEVVNLHSFTSTSSTLTLSDAPGMGAGYLMNLPNNEVFWDVRAIDGMGNATDWVSGNSFKLVAWNYSDSDMYRITDKTAPSAPGVLTAIDSIDDGKLNLAWSAVYDAFGMDHYDLAMYDASGKTLLKEITADAKGNGLLQLDQNDLMNGNYQYKIRGVDCAGNVGKYSALTAFTYDVVRPEFDIDSVECKVANGSATFTWDSMTDNLEAGKYSIEIKRDDMIQVAQETTDTSFVWNNIQSDGTFTYTIRAFDADGNESASAKNGSFVFEKPKETVYQAEDASVSGTIGSGYAADIWKVEFITQSVDGEYAAAEVNISLRVFTEESAGVDLIIRDKNGIRLSTVSVDSSWDGTFYWNEEKSMNNYYTVEVVPHDDSEKTAYALSINKTEYEDSNILDNTFEQARDSADYRVALTGNAEQQIIENEWLGFSDECDFRQLTVTQDKVYTFEAKSIDGLNMTLWQEYSGVLLAIAQGENSIDDVSLKNGATYYLEINSMGAKSVNYGVLASC